MKVSIITVVFNAEHTIGDALKSVASQNYPDIEHIVVDGASSDGSLSVIKANSSRVATLISEPDSGIYEAMNKGLSLATGDVMLRRVLRRSGLCESQRLNQGNAVLAF